MDFGKISSLAQSALSDDKKTDAPAQTSDQKWADVGVLAKQAAEGFQKDRAEGKGPDYAEIGKVAQKAFSAYQSEEKSGNVQADLTKIGKGIAGGVMGGKTEEAPKPVEEGEKKDEAPKPEGEPPKEGEKKEIDLPDSVSKQASEKFGVSEEQVSSIFNTGLKAFGSK